VLARPIRPRRAPQISDRDRDMRRRWKQGEPLDAIGKRWGITRERVRQRLLQCFGITQQSAA
jgi:DNA-directed RNA polymerase sigma subunit (sigma70/sigma32)